MKKSITASGTGEALARLQVCRCNHTLPSALSPPLRNRFDSSTVDVSTPSGTNLEFHPLQGLCRRSWLQHSRGEQVNPEKGHPAHPMMPPKRTNTYSTSRSRYIFQALRSGLDIARPTVAMCVLFHVLLSTMTVRLAIAVVWYP